MPLRFRLIALVFLALMASLALGGAITLLNASHSVQTEMRSALLVGRQTVDKFVGEIEGSPDPQRHLDDLVDSFKGSRHLRIWVTGNTATGEVSPVAEQLPFGDIPAWFVRMIGVMPDTDQVPITIGGRPFAVVVITTDPRDEVLEVWDRMTGSLVVLALFGGTTIPLIFLFIGRALRPLDRLTAAMEQVGQGDYSVRVIDRLTPELARLRDSFNRMAACLAATDADNRRLNEQLLTLQEEERSDIARDLHDEVGPFLFAIGVDVANLSRLLQEERVAELPGHIQSIAAATRHLQGQVRSMLGRLRPIALAEFGLAEALCSLVEFWRRRYPEIDYQVDVSPRCENLGNLVDTTVYRIVQECLSNAVRHGKPGLIEIVVARAPCGNARRDDAIVEVIDDGQGMNEAPGIGYGLIGMEERVRAMGGRLTFSNRPGGGFAVSAVLPCSEPRPLPAPVMPERA
jgi:two-component system sensor histidine kinase UhpB